MHVDCRTTWRRKECKGGNGGSGGLSGFSARRNSRVNPPNGQNIALPKRVELKAGAGGNPRAWSRYYGGGGGGGGVIIKGQKPVRGKSAGDGFGAGGGFIYGRSGAVFIKIGK